MQIDEKKLKLTSKARHYGGAGVKRTFGSSTVTEFYVRYFNTYSALTVQGYGKSPSERKTFAKKIVVEQFGKFFPGLVEG